MQGCKDTSISCGFSVYKVYSLTLLELRVKVCLVTFIFWPQKICGRDLQYILCALIKSSHMLPEGQTYREYLRSCWCGWNSLSFMFKLRIGLIWNEVVVGGSVLISRRMDDNKSSCSSYQTLTKVIQWTCFDLYIIFIFQVFCYDFYTPNNITFSFRLSVKWCFEDITAGSWPIKKVKVFG